MAALFLYHVADMLDQTRAYVRRLSFVLEWHRWFAWYPVPLDESEGRLRYAWLRFVERRWGTSRYSMTMKWRYRLPTRSTIDR